MILFRAYKARGIQFINIERRYFTPYYRSSACTGNQQIAVFSTLPSGEKGCHSCVQLGSIHTGIMASIFAGSMRDPL